MDVSVVGRQAGVAGSERLMLPAQSRHLVVGRQRKRATVLPVSRLPSRIGLGAVAWGGVRSRRIAIGVRAAVRSEAVKKLAGKRESTRKSMADRPQLFVGLPADAVSDCNTVNHSKAIAAGLKALKLLGVDGVELPVWWGIVEKEAMGKYDWSGYLALVQMIQDSGLLVRASLYTHASTDPAIPLPQWVSTVGEADPSVFFTDRAGNLHRECLSLSADDLPVLEGKTPMEVYRALLQSFRETFSSFLGSTITDILVGLGPDGELKYPSMPASRNRNATGAGEFQCYDKNMLGHLKLHAEATGNHFWGLSGPHDAPSYNQSPDSGTFFKDAGGSWETPYGDFFLSWYSGHLLAHGNRVLSMASAVLGDLPVQIHGKLPVMHAWSKSRSHPTELAAGLYNTVNRDGYDAIADMFARNSCGMILPSMDLADELQPAALRASPESLLSQIMRACNKHGVAVTGENSSVRGPPEGFVKIRDTLSRGRRASSPEEPVIAKFTYQRMGAYFFSPEHFPAFTQFVRSLEWSELHSDDLPAAAGETIPLTAAPSPKEITTRQMQTA